MTDEGRRQPSPESTSPGGGLRGAETGGDGPPVLNQVFDDESLYALRSAVAAHGSQAGLAEGRLGDLVLVVHELAANAIQHGAGRGRLRIWNTGTELRCEVTDDGTNHGSGGDAEAGRRDPAHWNIEPGHGLWVIRQVADRASLDASSSGTVASVAFILGPPGTIPPFRLARQLRDDCVLLAVTGQLDLGSARQFTGTFAGAFDGLPADGAPPCLVLDLSGLTGWDSCGLAALITAQQLVDNRPGGRMIVAGLPGHLRQRLLGADLPRRFTLAESVDDAKGMFNSPA
jgi:anti-sigma regulatory factor (Ser/Thr protein kinase)/anti-anti-sigma regulatory factor